MGAFLRVEGLAVVALAFGCSGKAPPGPQGPSAEKMVDAACTDGRCPASEVVRYWRDVWDEEATRRTIRFLETTEEDFSMIVTDDAGEPATLEFEIGRPVIVTLVNPSDGTTTGAHFLSSPAFFRTLAWRKVSTEDAEYVAPTFDAVGARFETGVEHRVELHFVPMQAGTWEAYCQLGVTDGSSFADIGDGTLLPDLSTGHAGAGMDEPIVVTGSLDVELDPEALERDPALDRDPRRASMDPVWEDPVRDETFLASPIVAREISEEEYAFEPASISLTVGTAYVIGLSNPVENTAEHTWAAPELSVTTVLRRAQDAGGDVRLPYLSGIKVKIGHEAQAWLVPTVAGSYPMYCSIGVDDGADGHADLSTGHAGMGMQGTIDVVE